MTSSDPPTPNPATRNTNENGPSPDEVARLAVRLLATGEELTSDPRQVSAAVTTARQLIHEAGQRPVRHACDLFRDDVLMTYADIEKTLEEYGWKKFGVANTFASRIYEILFELHRDIERRRDFLISSFRSEHLMSSPEDVETVAKQSLRELVGRLGFSPGFGEKLDDVVSETWFRLLESWLRLRLNVGDDLERTRLHTPEHFNTICVDTDYLTYCTTVGPMPEPDADRFLSVAFYLSESTRAKLESVALSENEINLLTAVNLWPERLFPGDRSLARPFAEFLYGNTMAAPDISARLEAFDKGIRGVARTLSAMKMKELHERLTEPDSRSCETEQSANNDEVMQAGAEQCRCDGAQGLLGTLHKIRNRCVVLAEIERERIVDTLVVDPVILTTNLIHFFAEGRYKPSIRLPFHGAKVSFKLLRDYARNLDSFRRDLEEMESLSLLLGESFDSAVPIKLVDAEADQVAALSGEFEDPNQVESREARLEQGRKFFFIAIPKKTKRWGRIRPRLLFAYARDKGLLDDELYLLL